MAWHKTLTHCAQIDLVERCLSTATLVAMFVFVIVLPRLSMLAWMTRERPVLSSFRVDALAGIAVAFAVIALMMVGVVVAWWQKRLVNLRRIAIKTKAEQYRLSLLSGPAPSDERRVDRNPVEGARGNAPILFFALILIPGGTFVALSCWFGLDYTDGIQDLMAFLAITGVTAYLARCALITVGTRLLAEGR